MLHAIPNVSMNLSHEAVAQRSITLRMVDNWSSKLFRSHSYDNASIFEFSLFMDKRVVGKIYMDVRAGHGGRTTGGGSWLGQVGFQSFVRTRLSSYRTKSTTRFVQFIKLLHRPGGLVALLVGRLAN